MRPSDASTDERLRVISAKVSAHERAVVEAIAAVTRTSLSSVVRALITEGAPERLREAAHPTGTEP